MLPDFNALVNFFGAELENNALQFLYRLRWFSLFSTFLQIQIMQGHYSLQMMHYLWDLTEIYSVM